MSIAAMSVGSTMIGHGAGISPELATAIIAVPFILFAIAVYIDYKNKDK